MSILIDKSPIERQLKKEDSKKDRAVSDVKFLLRFSEFRRFCKRILDAGFIFAEHELTPFEQGKRSLSNKLFKQIREADPQALIQIEEEHESEKVSEQFIEEQLKQKDKIGAIR